ncbi:4'-phosphopantetheinyl transferase superfamily protein [Agrobacterium vitis]|uniref:4'-phosphopantetheinyl transferase family protein n=1 Tax=Agrobacterium vitis TaxID=373 RepID=UPI0012E96B24|nr:4'-phosphopantetheinyl transferase superfamily protein [Agrobacterium vitis]MCM2438762.1 4'-phosphopantetheinyl transferase superfamily protein [Agrobacterium vitis]
MSGREPIPETLLRWLSDEETREAALVIDPAERARRLVAKAVLKGKLGSILDVEPSSLLFERTPHGKPFLALARFCWLRFNLSHSGTFVAVSLGRTELGIDIERHRPLGDVNALMDQYFCRDEHQFFLKRDGESHLEKFFSLWTRKEAILKAMGTGFSRSPESVSAAGSEIIEGCWRVHSIIAPPGYSAAVAWQI